MKPEPKAEALAAPKEQKEAEIFAPSTPKPAVSLNIVGKIDLDAINQTTRPKKKGKDERRNGKGGAQNNAAGQNNEQGRKKRQRIGKDKVDIEKAEKPPAKTTARVAKAAMATVETTTVRAVVATTTMARVAEAITTIAAAADSSAVRLPLPKSPKKTYRSRLRKHLHALQPRKKV